MSLAYELDYNNIRSTAARRRRLPISSSPARSTGAGRFQVLPPRDEFTEFESYDIPDWDGYGAQPIQTETVEAARAIWRLLPMGAPRADIAPGGDGTIGFEWRTRTPTGFSRHVIIVGPDDKVMGMLISPHGETMWQRDTSVSTTVNQLVSHILP